MLVMLLALLLALALAALEEWAEHQQSLPAEPTHLGRCIHRLEEAEDGMAAEQLAVRLRSVLM
jgi:hypothetical protein